MLDVRCTAFEYRHAGRCQLFAGHESAHARLHLDGASNRVLHRWVLGEGCTAAPFGCDVPVQLPWAPGFPRVESATDPAVEDNAPRQFEPPHLESVGSPPVLPVRRLHEFPPAEGSPTPG